MATRGGRVKVYFDADTSDLQRGTSRVQKQLSGVDKSTKKLNTGFAGAAKGVAGFVAAGVGIGTVVNQIKGAAETTEQLHLITGRLERSFGLSTKAAFDFARVAQANNINSRTLGMTFTTLAKNVDAVSSGTGSKGAAHAFSLLGISTKEVLKGHKDLNAFLPRVFGAFERLKGGVDRAKAAQALFGRGSQTLVPLLKAGETGLRGQVKMADQYFQALGLKAPKGANQLRIAQLRLTYAQLAWQTFLGEKLAPAILKTTNALLPMFRAIKRVSDAVGDADRFVRHFGLSLSKIASYLAPVVAPIKLIRLQIHGIGVAAGFVAGPLKTMKDSLKAVGQVAGKLLGVIRALAGAIKSIPGKVGGFLGGLIPGGATGFQNFPGGLAVVGEEGPELAVLPKGTDIISNRISKQMVGSLGVKGYASGTLSYSQIAALAKRAGFPNPTLAAAVALAESGGNIGAHGDVNLGGSWGLWQIHHPSHPGYSTSRLASDPLYNAKAAFAISGGGRNWNPWTTYRTGAYKQYLQDIDVPDYAPTGGGGGGRSRSKIRARARRREAAGRRQIERQANRLVKAGGLGRSLSDLSPFAAGAVENINRRSAEAALTGGTEDDIAAARTNVGVAQSLLTLARRSGSAGAISEAAGLVKSESDNLAELTKAVEDNTQAAQDQTAILEERNRLTAEQLQNTQTLLRASQSQYGVLAKALAAVVSGEIGGKIGLSFQSPGFAGGVTRY